MSRSWTCARGRKPSTAPEPMDRWRGPLPAGLALAALLVAVTAAAAAMASDGGTRWIVVRDDAGSELARAALPSSGEFALRYRNSVYESMAEERFTVDGGRLRLLELRADELAVLEEYYTASGATRVGGGAAFAWRAPVERPAVDLPHHVRATALGQRVLVVSGEEIRLWKLVEGRDDTLIVLTVETSS